MLKDGAGAAVAVLLPGHVALGAVTAVWAELEDFVLDSPASQLAVAALLGLFLGLARAAAVDPTFARRPRGSAPAEHPRGRGRGEPDYARLADPGTLGAFLEARASLLRPAQLYGNLLLAVLICVVVYFVDPGVGYRWRFCVRPHCFLPPVVALVLLAVLYAAARRSHLRYLRALERIESLP